MTVAEVDMDEILSQICTALTYRPTIDDQYSQFCKAYSTWGSWNNTPTSDGALLVKGWRGVFENVYRHYRQLALWEESGVAPFSFTTLLNNNVMVIEKTPEWKEEDPG
jgi:hypothetical protein